MAEPASQSHRSKAAELARPEVGDFFLPFSNKGGPQRPPVFTHAA
jgi:hypothetical protein